MRTIASLVFAAVAGALAAGPLGCHRDRPPQGDAATGVLPASAGAASAPVASTSPVRGGSAAGGDLMGVGAARAGAAVSAHSASPPPSTAHAGSVSPAPAMSADPSAPADKRFDQDTWLSARGVRWQPDKSCWSTVATNPPQRLNVCACHDALHLPEVELLVCSRGREQESEAVPFVTHTVLYAPRGGTLRVVLDVPTGATLDECAPGTPIPCAVMLGLRVDGAAIHLEEGTGAPSACDDPWISADKPLPGASAWNSPSGQRVRGIYRRVCGARGRYTWQRGVLRHAP